MVFSTDKRAVQKLEMKLYYCFLSVDGVQSKEELDVFYSIADAYKLPRGEVDQCRQECDADVFAQKGDACERTLEYWEKILDEAESNREGVTETEYRVIWNLLSLAYADGTYSSQEQRLVQYLEKRWKLNETLCLEMNSTISAVQAAEQKKAWASALPDDQKQTIVQEAEHTVQVLRASVERSIAGYCFAN